MDKNIVKGVIKVGAAAISIVIGKVLGDKGVENLKEAQKSSDDLPKA